MSARVLLFDSGLGGLTIAACVHRALPQLELFYLADDAGFPYGDRAEADVLARCRDLVVDEVRRIEADLVVIACNTASTLVLPALREVLSIPVVGVVPAIKPAAQLSQNRRIGILATPATIRRPYTEQLIRDFAADCEVIRVGHPDLVRWAERLVAGEEPPREALAEVLSPMTRAGVDTVVLGCTHYPLLQPYLARTAPGVEHWVDSGEAIARRVQGLLNLSADSARAEASGKPLSTRFTGKVPDGLPDFVASLGLVLDEAHVGTLPAG